MIWFVLAVLLVILNGLIQVGKLWGTEGVFLVMMLGFAFLAVLIYGSLASIAFTLKLPSVGCLLTLLMIGQLIHIGWSTYWDCRKETSRLGQVRSRAVLTEHSPPLTLRSRRCHSLTSLKLLTCVSFQNRVRPLEPLWNLNSRSKSALALTPILVSWIIRTAPSAPLTGFFNAFQVPSEMSGPS